MEKIYKYPRTLHIKGSKIQKGEEDLNTISFEKLKGQYVVIEEKVDGANCGISFDEHGKMYLQSRGHFLNGGYGEKQFALFKTWASVYQYELYELLGSRYVMYGEWLYAKHTIYYDDLPHYFMEFDIYDKKQHQFLSTKRRREMLSKYPFIVSVLVLSEGIVNRFETLSNLIDKSHFKTENWQKSLEDTCRVFNLSYELVKKQTDDSQTMEGLYIKVENEDEVLIRCKYVRQSFITTILDSETHWADRPITPNKLKDGVDLFKK